MPRGKHGNHARGSSHPRWSGSLITEDGYVKIRVGKGHQLADPNGYAYEHLVVWVSSGRDKPEKHQVIHHKNGDKRDNRIGNLEVVSRSEHNKLHGKYMLRDIKTGRFLGKRLAGAFLDGRLVQEWPERMKR